MNPTYTVKKLKSQPSFTVAVPGSKSITNRALMLAALSNSSCLLTGVLFSDDSRAFLDCLDKLGFTLDINEKDKCVRIDGTNGKIPNQTASVNVRSAGTAARFLTVMLALAGGNYMLDSSEQMKKRPMEPLLSMLMKAGVQITFMEKEGHFPFQLQSNGLSISELSIDTEISSQFASALLMAGSLVDGGLKLTLTGSRTEGAYIQITRAMLKQFGVEFSQNGTTYFINSKSYTAPKQYQIEPDVSAACYFYGLAAINAKNITVQNVHYNSMQGDIKFLTVLEKMGCVIKDTSEGISVKGPQQLSGISVDLKDFSDQTMTLAAIAIFANGITEIKNISHIRHQESDRLSAVINELRRMNIRCEEMSELKENAGQEGIRIYSGTPKPTVIETYEDHRMAMAFSLVGTRCEGIVIDNPACCAKTFETYFDVLDSITKS